MTLTTTAKLTAESEPTVTGFLRPPVLPAADPCRGLPPAGPGHTPQWLKGACTSLAAIEKDGLKGWLSEEAAAEGTTDPEDPSPREGLP